MLNTKKIKKRYFIFLVFYLLFGALINFSFDEVVSPDFTHKYKTQIVDKTTKISMNILMFWSFFKKNKPYD